MTTTYTFNSELDFAKYNTEYTKLVNESTTTEKSELKVLFIAFCERLSKAPYQEDFAMFLKDILNVKGEVRGVSL